VEKIKFDNEIIKYISLFESLTHTKLKDCIAKEDRLIFIVDEKEIGKAVGKKGINVQRIERSTNKKIKIIAYNEDILVFVRNLIYPSRAKDIREEDNKIIITPIDKKNRGFIIGRGGSILREHETIINRYFEIEEIKVI